MAPGKEEAGKTCSSSKLERLCPGLETAAPPLPPLPRRRHRLSPYKGSASLPSAAGVTSRGSRQQRARGAGATARKQVTSGGRGKRK